VHRLEVHEHARDDLERLRALYPKVVARVLVKLQEIKGDPIQLAALLEHGFGRNRDEEIDVKKWLEFWRRGKDIWRLKFWELEDVGLKYRVVYAYVPDELTFYVLAVVHRSLINYDDTQHELAQRVLADYQTL
jgi:mRNA-degrading endonuclease RelE of RelBE toxin-antitoxin system